MNQFAWRSPAQLAESLDGMGQNGAELRFAIKLQAFDEVQKKVPHLFSASFAGSARTGSFPAGYAFIFHVVGIAVKCLA